MVLQVWLSSIAGNHFLQYPSNWVSEMRSQSQLTLVHREKAYSLQVCSYIEQAYNAYVE